MVRVEVEKYFGRPPRTDLNPDEVVAWGAAIQAENLANAGENLPSRAVLLDVTPGRWHRRHRRLRRAYHRSQCARAGGADAHLQHLV